MWLPMAEQQVYPWDAWVPLCWVAILLSYQARRYWLVIVLIPVCSLLKETTIVLSILILFERDKTLRSRLVAFGCVVGVVLIIKVILSHVGGADHALINQTFRYPTPCRTGETWIFMRNLHSLAWWRDFNPIWLSGAGLWLGFIIAPIRLEYRLVAAAYFAITVMVCVMTEARLWQEMLVLFMVGFADNISGLQFGIKRG